MSPTCKICGGKARSEYCFRHKPKKAIKKTPLKKKTVYAKKRHYPKKKRGTKSKSLRSLKTMLDRVFSVYIRMRDANSDGYVSCFTSGKIFWWKDSQCGHFASRRFNATRWHEKNCHAQSAYDNMYLAGQQYLYGVRLDETYGEGTAAEIMELANTDFKLTIEWLQERIEHYRKEVLRLKKEKNL